MRWSTCAFLFLLIMTGAYGAVDPVAAQAPRNAVFKAPVDAVWQSAIETVADSHFEVQSSEKSSGVIWLKEFRTVGNDTRAMNLIKQFTTKKVRTFSPWFGISISGSLTFRGQPDSTEVECHFKIAGYKERMGVGEWEQLESNGSLESGILTGISNRLKNTTTIATRTPQSSQSENSLSELIPLADSMVEKLRKVDAGFKIDAPADTITSILIEAQAQFDEFVSYKWSADSSGLTDNLATTLDAFKRARPATGQTRTDALVQARTALVAAAETVRTMKSAAK